MSDYLKANHANPYMGLNNKICRDPKYWCAIHEVWLSEEDVKKKGCLSKPTFDMLDTRVCLKLKSGITAEDLGFIIKKQDEKKKSKVPAKGSYDWKKAIGLTWE